MLIDSEDVRRISHLARLKIEEDDLHRYSGEMSILLSWFESISSLDTSNVDDLIEDEKFTPPREGNRSESLSYEYAVSNASSIENRMFKVPCIVDKNK